MIVVGNSQMPQLCQKKDEKAFMDYFQKHVYFPLPDYASMRILWPGLIERAGGACLYEFDLSTLAQLSEGYSGGTINTVCRTVLTDRRINKLDRKPLGVQEILGFLCKFDPVSKVSLYSAVSCDRLSLFLNCTCLRIADTESPL